MIPATGNDKIDIKKRQPHNIVIEEKHKTEKICTHLFLCPLISEKPCFQGVEALRESPAVVVDFWSNFRVVMWLKIKEKKRNTLECTVHLYCVPLCDKKFSIGCYASPEEIEGFVFQHQAAVACQVQLL